MSTRPRPHGQRRDAPADTPPTVLVVDADPAVRHHLETALTRRGHWVFTAATARDAMAVLRHLGPYIGVALVDVRLPDDPGPEVLKALRLLRPELPAVFMSGDLDRDLTAPLADAVRSEGADGLIAKPLDVDELCEVLRDATVRRGIARVAVAH